MSNSNNSSLPNEYISSPNDLNYLAKNTKSYVNEFYPVEPKRTSSYERLPPISQLITNPVPVLPPSSELISEVEKRERSQVPNFNGYNHYYDPFNMQPMMYSHPYFRNSMPKPKQTTKRLRRKYDEIVRLYKCNYGTCSKSYGTLNHLNCHIQLQNHGKKRSPNEFRFLIREDSKEDEKIEPSFN